MKASKRITELMPDIIAYVHVLNVMGRGGKVECAQWLRKKYHLTQRRANAIVESLIK